MRATKDKMEKQNEKQARKYRIVIHNLNVNNETVREAVESELGDVNILNWEVENEIHYSAKIHPFYMANFPQRETIVKLDYLENEKTYNDALNAARSLCRLINMRMEINHRLINDENSDREQVDYSDQMNYHHNGFRNLVMIAFPELLHEQTEMGKLGWEKFLKENHKPTIPE